MRGWPIQKFSASLKLLSWVMLGLGSLSATSAFAQSSSSSPLAPVSENDWAIACIDFLFRGSPLPESLSQYSARLNPLADALRHALGTYSMAMLLLAGVVLFYHLAAMMADTAHDGVVMGRKTNQVWAPIRLAVAVILLAPVGSGLSSGQYLVLKIATAGSNLASNAWQAMVGAISEDFSLVVSPRGPNVTSLVTLSTEMEICRLLYNQVHTAIPNEILARLVGPIGDLTKLPPTRTSFETWRYSNLIDASSPLCGELRFTGYRRHGLINSPYTDSVARVADDLSSFSHTEADSLLSQSRSIAEKAAPFLSGSELPNVLSIQSELDRLADQLRKQINAHLTTLASLNMNLAEKYLARPAEAGWISSGFFIPEMVRLQESYGEMVDHMMPEAEGPVLSHPLITELMIEETITNDPTLRNLDHDTIENLRRYYSHIARLNARASDWLFNSQLSDNDTVPITGFDIRDQLTAASDSNAGFDIMVRALDDAAVAHGVWGIGPTENDPGNPFAALGHDKAYNPLAVIIEFGRRQWALGSDLIGLAGNMFPYKPGYGPALITTLLGLLFSCGGVILIFITPLLPFFRFLMGVLTWLLELFEALAAMPIVSLAHLTPSGEGISGGVARQAYMLWIGLAVRPLLTLFGLVIGLILFALGLSFLEVALTPLARLANFANSGILITTNTALVLLFDALTLATANMAFKGIDKLPNQSLRWISTYVVTDSRTTVTPSQNATLSPALQQALLLSNQSSSREVVTNNATSAGNNAALHSALFPITSGNPASSTQNPSIPGTQGSTTSTSSGTAPGGGTITGYGSGSSSGGKSGSPSKENRNSDTKPNPSANLAFFQNKDKPNDDV